jgi:hypothetical protein
VYNFGGCKTDEVCFSGFYYLKLVSLLINPIVRGMKMICPINKPMIEKCAKLAEKGIPWNLVCPVGVSSHQMRNWIKTGREMNDNMIEFGEYPKGSTKLQWMCHELYLALGEAHKKFVIKHVSRLDKASAKTWVVSLKLLEMREREGFGKAIQIDEQRASPGDKQGEASITITLPDNGRG